MILKEAGRPNPDDPERCSRPEVALVELGDPQAAPLSSPPGWTIHCHAPRHCW